MKLIEKLITIELNEKEWLYVNPLNGAIDVLDTESHRQAEAVVREEKFQLPLTVMEQRESVSLPNMAKQAHIRQKQVSHFKEHHDKIKTNYHGEQLPASDFSEAGISVLALAFKNHQFYWWEIIML